jgi:hypothetical protein
MLIAVINTSTLVSNADIITMCAAIQKQLVLHFLPAWNMKSATVRFYSNIKSVPGYAWLVNIIDDDTQVPGALGFHQQETSGLVDAFIMCKPVLDNGGAVLNFDPVHPSKYTISGTLSHEILEMVCDRFTNTFCDVGSSSWCQEMCDPVEQISYGIQVGITNVAVSDFVFPNFFNPDAKLPENAPLNYLNTLTKSFTILPGGYAIVRPGGPGTERQIFGEAMPEWKKELKSKSFSRFSRRTQK